MLNQEKERLDDASQSSDDTYEAALQYPRVVSDLNRKGEAQHKMGTHSPKTSQILQAQHQIWYGKGPQFLREDDNESCQPSQSSEDPNGAPLQYPRVVADLGKSNKD